SVKLYQGAARPATAATLRARALWAKGPRGGSATGRNQGSAYALSARSPHGNEMGRYLLLWLVGVPLLGVDGLHLAAGLRRLTGPVGLIRIFGFALVLSFSDARHPTGAQMRHGRRRQAGLED